MKLATFDIFDTSLIRRCGVPEAVFHLVAARLWPDDGMRRTEYLNLRRQAAGKETLAEIYAVPGMNLFPELSADELMAAEKVMEAEQLTVNPVMRRKIVALRKDGWTIKFLSDMYLPSDFLASILKREGCLEGDEEVIVSCEWTARKDTGLLYRKVKEKYKPEKWVHFGDNRRSDYKMARRNGVKAELVEFGFSAVERRIVGLTTSYRDGWIMSLLAGASRVARIKASLDAATTLAADYVAAAYIPYVVWLLRRAKSVGLKRLHFLSRDGYIMMKIAEALEVDGIELNYLFVSRKALMKAYLVENSAERFVEIADHKSLVGRKVDYFLGQMQLDRNHLKEKYGVEFGYERIVNEQQQEDFLNKIFKNDRLSPVLDKQFSAEAELTTGYLRQEGLTDGTAQAMVDIGWLGTSRMMVNRILSTDIPTYYVGVRGDVYDRSCGDFDSYFAVEQLDTTATGLIENYYSASPWPSTIGYKRNEKGLIEPLFADGKTFAESSVTEANVRTCLAVVGELKPYLDWLDDEKLYRWAKISLDSIVDMEDQIDISPLTAGSDFDGVPMARKLNLLELFCFTFTGARYTAFDRASLRISIGAKLDHPVWTMHQLSSKIRAKLYRYILKHK